MTRKIARIQLRRGTSAQWAAADPVLAPGEMGTNTETFESRIGDGVKKWSELPRATDAASNAAQTAADRVQTGLDRVATGENVTLSRAWAESPTPPVGGDSKSSKTWALESAASATSAALSSAAAGAASGRLVVKTFAELATVPVYADPGAGQQITAAGDYIHVLELDAYYLVLASGASGADLDYTATGGVKLNQTDTSVALFNIIRMAKDVRNYGAVPDDEWTEAAGSDGSETNNYAAIQAAITDAIADGNGEVIVKGQYAIEDRLVADAPFAGGLKIVGDGQTSRIRQKGVGKDLIQYSASNVMQSGGIYDIALRTMATAGHVVNIGYGLSQCEFENVFAWQGNPDKSIWTGNFDAGGDGNKGVYTSRWRGGTWYSARDATVHPFDIVANGTRFNENVFESITPYYSDLIQFFRIINTSTDSWFTNNEWRKMTFQVCAGGGLLLYNVKGSIINAAFWDTASYVNNLIHFAPTVGGLGSIGNTLIGVSRNGDALASGVRDIFTEDAEDTTLINCYTDASASPSYNWNNKRVFISGPPMAGQINTNFRVLAADGPSAYAVFAGATGSASAADNFASVVRTGTGVYRLTFIAARSAGYRVHVTISAGTVGWVQTTKTTGYVDIVCIDSAGAAFDPGTIDVTVFGS